AQAEPPQAAAAADVRKHRLGHRKPATVLIAPVVGVDLALHASAAGLRLARGSSQEERDLSDQSALGMRQAPGAQRARPAVPLGPFEDHRAIAVRPVVLAARVPSNMGTSSACSWASPKACAWTTI